MQLLERSEYCMEGDYLQKYAGSKNCKRNCMKEIDELEMHAACICFKKPSKPASIYQKQVHSGNQVTLW